MKLLELLKVRGSLLKYKSVAGPEVSFDTKYKIARFLFDTDKDAKFYLESVALLEQQYSSRKEEHVDKIKQAEYESKIEELLNTETEKTITFTREELSGFNMSVDDLICLYNCIKDGAKIENN